MLHALTAGLLCREPPAVLDWLALLERHLDRVEDPEVWRTLAALELWHLRRVPDQRRLSAFVEVLFERYPEVLASQSGVLLVARLQEHLPAQLVQSLSEKWKRSDWTQGPQAFGEFVMLRHAMIPGDEYCAEAVRSAAEAIRLGLAFSASRLWKNQRYRAAATRVLLSLIPTAEGRIAEAILDIFLLTDQIPVDDNTRVILDALVHHPEILRVAHGSSLAKRLRDLLCAGVEPEPVGTLVSCLLDAWGPQLADIRTSAAAHADELIQIAITLQRFPQSRVQGLELFERLMDVGAYGIDEVLLENDRRFASR